MEELARTQRTRLRPLRKEDAGDYFAIFGSAEVARHEDFVPISETQAAEDVAAIARNYGGPDDTHEYAVELLGEDRVVGVLCYLEDEGRAMIGFHFNPEYFGRGLATESVSAFLEVIRDQYGKPIGAVVDPSNVRSIALLERLGLQQAGERQVTIGGVEKRELIYRLQR